MSVHRFSFLAAVVAVVVGVGLAKLGPERVMTLLQEVRSAHGVEVRNVQAIIVQAGALTGPDLLGMSFLGKLRGFGIEAGRLVLKQ